MAFQAYRFSESSFVTTTFRFEPEAGTTRKSLLDPAEWANVSARLKAKDIIEVVPEDLGFYARLIVVEAAPTFARVKEIEFRQLDDETHAVTDDNFEVAFKGPVLKWCVIRKQDGALVFERLPSREAANAKLQSLKAPKAA